MAISDAQFAQWLIGDGPRVVLAELRFSYESAGAPAEGTVYLSSGSYFTRPEDSPPNVAYRDTISGLPGVRMSINPDSLGGFTQISVGELTLHNGDGSLDFLLDLIIDGREVNFYLGSPEWPRSDFRVMLSVLAESAAADGDDTIRITLRDHRLLLDRAIAGDVVTAEKRKPLIFCFGSQAYANSIEPVLLDSVDLDYCVLQNYANSGLGSFVRDNGAELSAAGFAFDNTTLTVNAGTDTFTFVAHGLDEHDVVRITRTSGSGFYTGITSATQYWVISAGLTLDDFRISLTKGGAAIDITGSTLAGAGDVTVRRYFDNVAVDGTIQLSSPPAGRVTVDVKGLSASQSTSPTSGGIGELMRAMLIDYGDIASGDIDAASFQDIYSEFPSFYEQFAARAVLTRENLLDVLDDLSRVGQIYWGTDRTGTFRAFRLNLSALSGETADHELTADGVIGYPKVANQRVINGRVFINSGENYTQLTYGELAASLSDATKAAYAAKYRETGADDGPTGTAYATAWQDYFKTAVDTVLEGAFAMDGIRINSTADEIIGDLHPHIRVVDLETDLRAYNWRLGDVVDLAYPRYGFDAGMNFRLIGHEPDLVSERVKLTLITRITPDYTTSDYP